MTDATEFDSWACSVCGAKVSGNTIGHTARPVTTGRACWDCAARFRRLWELHGSVDNEKWRDEIRKWRVEAGVDGWPMERF